MRVGVRSIHGMGDFVPGWFAVPQTPVGAKGMGDFVPGMFAVPQTPVGAKGMHGLGCGSDCGCGPCRSQYGMGQVDLSLTGTGIVTSIEGAFSQTGWPAVPNWVFYAGGIAIVFAMYQSSQGKHRR